jgi:DNA-binding transcriptional LysR family regulator
MATNWREVNFDWNHVRAFLATMQAGSMSSAASLLGVSQPTLSRQIAALEQSLGNVLFERVGRGLEATPVATRLLEHVQAMGEAANQLALTASGNITEIKGSISIACTEIIAVTDLPPIISELKALHPELRINLVVSNEVSDLKRREADIAIRQFRPSEPDLIARKISDFTASLYCTPEYSTSLTNTGRLADFDSASFIGFPEGINQEYLGALNKKGFQLSESNFYVLCNSHYSQWEFCKQGLGICVIDCRIGDHEPRVQRIRSELTAFSGEYWLVSHRELRTNSRVRAVFDLLYERMYSNFA